MRHVTASLIILLIIYSCNNSHQQKKASSEVKEELSLEGTWKLTGFYNYIDNKVSDSFLANNGYNQVKIYTPTKVMWSRVEPNDSTDWFGFGSYTKDSTKLIEYLDFGSKVMNKVIEENNKFEFELILEKDKFIQIELDENGDRIFSENYERIE